MQAMDANEQITTDYWHVFESFIQMIEEKQNENLKMLSSNSEQQDLIFENIKSEIDYHHH